MEWNSISMPTKTTELIREVQKREKIFKKKIVYKYNNVCAQGYVGTLQKR